MPGEILVDTNIVIAVFKRQTAVLDRIAAAAEIYVASISVGELIFGALKSTNQALSTSSLASSKTSSPAVVAWSPSCGRSGAWHHWHPWREISSWLGLS
jgi:predicted nucleic acid-binding protein